MPAPFPMDQQNKGASSYAKNAPSSTLSSDDAARQIDRLAAKALSLCRDRILVNLRFLDVALAAWKPLPRPGLGCMATDGMSLFYDPTWLLKEYQADPRRVARACLHALLHCIFHHNFQYQKLDGELWDLAADLAVENAILEMRLAEASLPSDPDLAFFLGLLKEDAGGLTADRLYRHFRLQAPSDGRKEELKNLARRDSHAFWKPREELVMTMRQWKKISERVRADLKSFTKARDGEEALQDNLKEAVRDHYDYGAILRRFAVVGEDVMLNDEEFDYVFYHYGLELYGNLPLIEPLEYRETSKIREFVIAIDTSASCRGALVRAFLDKTYSILKSSDHFFTKTNVHIIQCDHEVRSDTKITNRDEFEVFLRHGKLQGFGATDFRPVFDYVEELREQKEFENLKGLIYFTDGYGIYPERMPGYDVIFAFLDEDENRALPPPWSIQVVLESEELEREEAAGREEAAIGREEATEQKEAAGQDAAGRGAPAGREEVTEQKEAAGREAAIGQEEAAGREAHAGQGGTDEY